MNQAFRLSKWLLLALALALIARSDWRARRSAPPLDPPPEMLARLLPGAENQGLVMTPLPHYPAAVAESGRLKPAAGLATARLEPKIKGYVDQINLFFVLDKDGVIRGVEVISDRETPYYMQMIRDSGLLDKFVGQNLRRGFQGIDAVSGATISSRAMIADLEAGAALAAKELYGIASPARPGRGWSAAVRDPRLISLAAVLAVALFTRRHRFFRRQKEVVFGLSLAVVGFWLNTPFSLGHLFQLLSLDIPGAGNARFAILAGFVLLTTLLAGPINCTYLCPFGALQELLFRFIPLPRWNVSPRILRFARELRWLVLFLCVVGYFGLGVHAFAEVEPFPHLFSLSQSPFAWLFIALTLILSLFLKRFWCRFFCPTGACLILLSSHRKYLKTVAAGVEESEIDPAGHHGT